VKVLSVWIRTAFFCLRPNIIFKRSTTTVRGYFLTTQTPAALGVAAFQAVTSHNSFNAAIAPAQPKRSFALTSAGDANYQ